MTQIHFFHQFYAKSNTQIVSIPLLVCSSHKNLSSFKGNSKFRGWKDPLPSAFLSLIGKPVLIRVQVHHQVLQFLYPGKSHSHNCIVWKGNHPGINGANKQHARADPVLGKWNTSHWIQQDLHQLPKDLELHLTYETASNWLLLCAYLQVSALILQARPAKKKLLLCLRVWLQNIKHKKERSHLLPSFAPLLWNYTGKNDVVCRPKDIAERKVVLEKEHLSHKHQVLQWISSLGWGSFFLRAFPALLIQITKAMLISIWAALRLLLRFPSLPFITHIQQEIPARK